MLFELKASAKRKEAKPYHEMWNGLLASAGLNPFLTASEGIRQAERSYSELKDSGS